ALRDHLLALAALAGLVRRGGEVQDDSRARQRLLGERRAGLPDVLADREPYGNAVHVDRRRARAALEVADLVEDSVVGQVDLAVDRLHRAFGTHRGGVVDVDAALGEADDRDEPRGVGRDALERR